MRLSNDIVHPVRLSEWIKSLQSKFRNLIPPTWPESFSSFQDAVVIQTYIHLKFLLCFKFFSLSTAQERYQIIIGTIHVLRRKCNYLVVWANFSPISGRCGFNFGINRKRLTFLKSTSALYMNMNLARVTVTGRRRDTRLTIQSRLNCPCVEIDFVVEPRYTITRKFSYTIKMKDLCKPLSLWKSMEIFRWKWRKFYERVWKTGKFCLKFYFTKNAKRVNIFTYNFAVNYDKWREYVSFSSTESTRLGQKVLFNRNSHPYS